VQSSSHHTNLTDEELLLRYRQSADNYWLGLLLQRYALLLLGVAMKYLQEKALAEDAVQQVFLKALTHLPQAEIINFKGWLYVLTRNHCLQTLRDAAPLAPESSLEKVAGDAEPLEDALRHELHLTELEKAIEELGPEQQTCIRAFYLQRKSYQEITAATGYSFAQVKSYIQNGKRNLKIILSRRTSI